MTASAAGGVPPPATPATTTTTAAAAATATAAAVSTRLYSLLSTLSAAAASAAAAVTPPTAYAMLRRAAMAALDGVEIAVAAATGRASAAAASPFLAGGFAPAPSTQPPRVCTVDAGSLPPDVAGTVARVGPNPHPRNGPVSGYHWFDGDGYVHAVRLGGGRATYAGQWVATAQLLAEVRAGFPRYGRLGSMVGVVGALVMGLSAARARVGLGLRPAGGGKGGGGGAPPPPSPAAKGAAPDGPPADAAAGRGTANTALVVHARRVLALGEGGLPYALRVACEGVVQTLGATTFGRGAAGRGGVWTAHPREDAATGELIGVHYHLAAAPYAEVVTVSPGGRVTSVVPIGSMPRAAMIHDTALTERFVLVLDGPLRLEPARMVREGTLPFVYHPEQPLRIGLHRRGDAGDGRMAWFSAPNGFIFHTVAAWEAPDGETVTLVACTYDRVELSLHAGASTPGVLTRYDLHLASGGVTTRRLYTAGGGVDFPRVAATAFRGSAARPRYVYLSRLAAAGAVEMDALVKYDLTAEAVAGVARMPPDTYCGEAVFVPRGSGVGGAAGAPPAAAPAAAAEDDGYLMTYTWSGGGAPGVKGATSALGIWDAATMAPVATLGLGGAHVPYGFHGVWLPADGPTGTAVGVEVPVDPDAEAVLTM